MGKYCYPRLCTWVLAASVFLMVGWVLIHGSSIFGTSKNPRLVLEKTIHGQEEDQMYLRHGNRMGSEFLSKTDKIRYKSCTSRAIKVQNKRGKTLINGTCRFMDGSKRAPVALASFQGSGNTWMRGLLEKATGICTGSTYCDVALRIGRFNGESLDSGVVVVVKTHNFSKRPKWTTQKKPISVNKNGATNQNRFFQNYCYSSTILIVRNPYNALVADWHRACHLEHQTDGKEHTGVIGPKNFGNNKRWNAFVKKNIPNWKAFFNNWLIPASKGHFPILVVKFEDLKKDRVGEMKKVLGFLNMSHQYRSDEEFREKLEGDYDSFKRIHNSQTKFEHFTSSQRKLVNSVILRTKLDLMKTNDGNTFGIQEYLN